MGPLICPECLAECHEPKHFNRFKKRHIEGKICQKLKLEAVERRSFSEQLAQGTRSVVSESNLYIEEGVIKQK